MFFKRNTKSGFSWNVSDGIDKLTNKAVTRLKTDVYNSLGDTVWRFPVTPVFLVLTGPVKLLLAFSHFTTASTRMADCYVFVSQKSVFYFETHRFPNCIRQHVLLSDFSTPDRCSFTQRITHLALDIAQGLPSGIKPLTSLDVLNCSYLHPMNRTSSSISCTLATPTHTPGHLAQYLALRSSSRI